MPHRDLSWLPAVHVSGGYYRMRRRQVKRLQGEGKDMVPETPPMIMFVLGLRSALLSDQLILIATQLMCALRSTGRGVRGARSGDGGMLRWAECEGRCNSVF